MTVNGEVSFWFDPLPEPGPGLPGDAEADVAIVGGGFTGLWTAYYLAKARPGLRITVLEQRFCGYGASGRNGGWLTNSITGGRASYAAAGKSAVEEFQAAMNQTVDEVIRIAAEEGIDADLLRGGELTVARNPAQWQRAQAFAAAEAQWRGADVVLLSAPELAERLQVAGGLGGTWQPHCARLNPVKLLRGLLRTVRSLGVQVFESSKVLSIEPGLVRTERGEVRAPQIVRATEGFTAQLPGLRRRWLPLNSSMIVTEPLGPEAWNRIGWQGGETVGDFAHVYMYAQRTADGRIALGGRGKPYRFGSAVDADGATPEATLASLTKLLREMFPAAAPARIEHVWSGTLGVPRDWRASVTYDAGTGLAAAGGYVGTGVATTNLAGRTLRDLLLGTDSELARLPWVNRKVQQWEPEPLRWLAVNGLYAAYRAADAQESAGARAGAGTSFIASLADRISGHR